MRTLVAKKAFKIHYTRNLRRTHNMLADGKKQFAVGDVVVISDLSISKRQPPYPVLGVVQEFSPPDSEDPTFSFFL